MIKRLFILPLALILTSCDTFYGIHRTAEIAAGPDLQLVDKAIRTVSEINRVTHKRERDAHVFIYYGAKGIRGSVWIRTDATGKKTFNVNYIVSNNIPSQEVIDRNYRVMLKVEEQIEQQCGLNVLTESIRETSSPKLKHKDAQPTSGGDSTNRADAVRVSPQK